MFDFQQVDSMRIHVLIDNVTDSLSSAPPHVIKEWSVLQSNSLRVISGDALCCANHGLSLMITTHGPNGDHTLLFDAGPADYAFERNGTRLGVDFSLIEAIVLSHGHWDHAGGIPRALTFILQANGKQAVPLYLHPEMFHQRGTRLGTGPVLPMERVLGPEEWSLLGAAPKVSREPQLCLDDAFFISGVILRVTHYAVAFPGHVRAEPSGTWQPDELIMDERFVAVHVRDKGLVVFSACSHAAIVNVLREALGNFPGIPLYAVMGGFHLAGTNERIVPQTVRDMKQIAPMFIVPAHCTGWRAENALERAFGEDVILPCSVGKVSRFYRADAGVVCAIETSVRRPLCYGFSVAAAYSMKAATSVG